MPIAAAKRDHRRMIGEVERDAFGFAGDAGIARRAVKLVDKRACRHLPGQRMLAPAGAQKQDVHLLRRIFRRCPSGLASGPNYVAKHRRRADSSISLPPLCRTDMNEPRLNLPELTVSELSMALKRTVEDSYGYVRVRGEVSVQVSYHIHRPCLFRPQGRRAKIAGVIWTVDVAAHRLKPEAGLEVMSPAGSRPIPAAPISDHRRDAGARRPRRADGAPGRAQAETRRRGIVRRGAQAAVAVSAGRDRRHHLADRSGDPRHPAPAGRSLSAPRARLAGQGAGRGLGRRGCRRDRGLQRAGGDSPLGLCRRGRI